MSDVTPSHQPTARTNATVTVSPTEYVILTRDEAGRWVQAGENVKAYSSEAAVKSLEAAGTYVAVPARSWKPVKVSAVQSVTLKLEEAS